MRLFAKNNSILVTILIGLLCGIIGWQIGHYSLSVEWKNYQPAVHAINQTPPQADQNIDFKLFWDTWNLVSQKYVDKKAIDPQKMYYGAIQGMVAAVGDPYTVFLPPEAQKATQEELGGSFSGVGIELGYDKDKHLVVIAPLDGTPAKAAGIQAGDIIVKINGKDTSGVSLPDAVNLIRGPLNSKVSLEIYHSGDDKTKTVDLLRQTIVVKSVEYSAKKTPQGKNVAYIKLSRFGERTEDEWQQGVASALGAAPDGVVLDLRNNPGGYLDAAVFIGSEFLPTGDNVVLQENSQGQRQPYPVNRTGKLLNLPLVVLINKGSASASEIVSGAIQDYKRGKLIGTQSFGKGTIQETQSLDGGTGIHITTAKWLTPNGRWIHQIGLTPDVAIEATASADPLKDNQLDKALQVLDGGQ